MKIVMKIVIISFSLIQENFFFIILNDAVKCIYMKILHPLAQETQHSLNI